MDPDETLQRIRSYIAEVNTRTVLDRPHAAAEALHLFEALDNWITKGGFLLAAWRPK